MYLFNTPTVEENLDVRDRLFMRTHLTRAVSVLKIEGEYYEMRYPSQDEIAEAQIVYQGGHEYHVSDAEAADLIAAGYEVTAL
jgi:hypothetical protein